MTKLLGILLAAGAMAVAFAMPASATELADPGQLIQTVAANIIEIVKTKRGADREAAMRAILRHDFDLPYMASIVLGGHWIEASEEQKARILAAIEASEARGYGERLGSLPVAALRVGAATARTLGIWLVDSRLELGGGQSIKLAWEVHAAHEGLRIVDVKVAGVSLFQTRRADFDAYIRSHGGTVEPLVQVLEARAQR